MRAGDALRAPRIELPSPEQMTPEQLRVYESVVSGRRGRMVGPLRAVILSPELAERWSPFGEFLRYGTSIPARQKELAIIMTARRWTSIVEWAVHADAARDAGIPGEVIEAIRLGKAPVLSDPDDAIIYEFTRQLHQYGHVEIDAYQRVQARWQAIGSVELTAIIGYYTMVSMMLNAHEIPLPEGARAGLADMDGLVALPPLDRPPDPGR